MLEELMRGAEAGLVSEGWKLSDGAAIAVKTYDTAVGPKEAHVHWTWLEEGTPNVHLQGWYWSEGNNILSTSDGVIPRTDSFEAARLKAIAFSKEVDRVVGQSYAARLLKL